MGLLVCIGDNNDRCEEWTSGDCYDDYVVVADQVLDSYKKEVLR